MQRMVWPFVVVLAAGAVIGGGLVAIAFAGWPPAGAALVYGLGLPVVFTASVALIFAGLPLPAVGLGMFVLFVALQVVYDRLTVISKVRTVSVTSLAHADRDIDPGPGKQAVLELQRAGYDRIGAFVVPSRDGRSSPIVVLRSEDGETYAEVLGHGGCHLTSSFGTLRLSTSRRSSVVHPARVLRQRVRGGVQKVIAAHTAALGLLAARHKEPRCLSEVEILDEIEADTYEECRLAVGVTFVEHLVAPVRNRRKAARLDRDKRATARIEHWLESEAATA